jgi:hypothetical protein
VDRFSSPVTQIAHAVDALGRALRRLRRFRERVEAIGTSCLTGSMFEAAGQLSHSGGADFKSSLLRVAVL